MFKFWAGKSIRIFQKVTILVIAASLLSACGVLFLRTIPAQVSGIDTSSKLDEELRIITDHSFD